MLALRRVKSQQSEKITIDTDNIYLDRNEHPSNKDRRMTAPIKIRSVLPTKIKSAIQRLKSTSIFNNPVKERLQKVVKGQKQENLNLEQTNTVTQSIENTKKCNELQNEINLVKFHQKTEKTKESCQKEELKRQIELQEIQIDAKLKEVINIQCNICEMIVEADLAAALSPCSHAFCILCLEAYFIYRISTMQNIICPEQNCHAMVDQDYKFDHILSKLSLKIQGRFKNHKIWKENLDNQFIRLCPEENCIEGTIDTRQIVAVCSKCQVVFCSECMMRMHEGNCGENFQILYQQLRRCPSCRIFIQKTQGCNHMTCRCGYEFDFVTLMKWEHVQNHQERRHRCSCSLSRSVICLLWSILMFFLYLMTPIVLGIFGFLYLFQYILSFFRCLIQSFIVFPQKTYSQLQNTSTKICFLLLYILFCPLIVPFVTLYYYAINRKKYLCENSSSLYSNVLYDLWSIYATHVLFCPCFPNQYDD